MGVGFELSDSGSGTYYRLDDPLRDRAIGLSLHLEVDGLRRFLRDRKLRAAGTIVAEGLAERGKPLSGTLAWRLLDERRVTYDLAFDGDDGNVYRLRGQREFLVFDALDSLTLLPSSLYDDAGVEIGRATLRFDPRQELPQLLRSFRPRVRLLSRGTP